MNVKFAQGLAGMLLSLLISEALAETPIDPPTRAAEKATSNAAGSDWVKKVENLDSWLEWGGDIRFRWTYAPNAFHLDKGLDEERHYQRYRTRLWTKIKPVEDVELNADFTASPISGVTPLQVTFTDQSTGDITAWLWDLGDGSTSTDQNPSHTYDVAGTYTVTLEVFGTGGSDAETETNLITASEPQPEIKNPDTFIIATIGDPDTLDPAYAYDTASAEQIQSIYDPLIWFDGASTSDFIPALATERTISTDGMTYRFKIREGVTFHNGNPLTPEDVEYSFERAMVQDRPGGPAWMFLEPLLGVGGTRSGGEIVVLLEEITSAVEVDGQWVQFNLPSPYEPFMQILAQSWSSIVDREWCMENGDWDGTQESYEALNGPAPGEEPLHAIANGTGPYELERWDSGVEIVLLRNDGYWTDPAPLERIYTKVVEDWTTRKLQLRAGDADWIYVPRPHIGELEGVEGLLVYKDLPELSADAFFFQFVINPDSTWVGSGQLDGNGIPLDFFQDEDIRKAFNYCFDWDTYIEDVMLGEAKQVPSPIIDGLAYFNPDQDPVYSKNLELARAHLEAAWGGEVWEKGFQFTITYNAGNLPRKTACEILAANLVKIDSKFRVSIQVMTWSIILDDIINGSLPMYQIGWQADYPDPHNFIHPFMHSYGAFAHLQNYSNPDIDALIEAGIAATTSAERQAIYYELQESWIEEVPGIILPQPLGRRYFRDWVQGYVFNPTDPCDVGHFYYLSKEYPS